jgi:putative phosphonate catabolism associated alcohol dehydrogenase
MSGKGVMTGQTARIAVVTEAGRPLQQRCVAIPPLAAGELLVRVAACAICGSDLHTFHGRRPHPLPTILGHEIAGTVVATGPEASVTDVRGAPVAVGDRVTWGVCVSCGVCDRCRRGLPQKCRHVFKYGHADDAAHPLAGGFADHVLLRRGTAIVRLPAGLSAAAAATASCAVATAAAVLGASGGVRGRSVVVLGAGMLGLSVASLAAAGGAASLTVIDARPERLDMLASVAATANTVPWPVAVGVLERLVAGTLISDGADVVVEACGTAVAAAAATRLVATGGTCVLAGTVAPVGDVPLDPERLVRRQATVRGVHNYRPDDLVTAVDHLASSAGAGLAAVAGPVMPLAAIDEALAAADRGVSVRVVVAP